MPLIPPSLWALMTLVLPVLAQSSCSTTLKPSNAVQPTVASGFRAQLVVNGLSKPRSLQFDSAGNLLVVEQGLGNGSITAIQFNDNGASCLEVARKSTVIANHGLNHGIALSSDGRTLYASSPESVWSWMYNPDQRIVSDSALLVTNMTTDDHTTRTLLLPQRTNGSLVVSRGSTSNLDLEAASLGSGHSQIKAFDLHNLRGSAYDFDSDGIRLGWGLRNSVGVAEHPLTGGIYSVENSADNIQRSGRDIHQDNPGEELNFHGYLNGTGYAFQGQNYGYPFCFAAWQVADIPENGNISVGSQFAVDPTEGQSRNDSYCVAQVPPRLTFQAHMAPLDIKFNDSGTSAWVTYHGSWDRTSPVGYKLCVIAFANGEPVAAPDNKTAVVEVFSNSDNSVCPDHCFRPVGIAFDRSGRLFMSSDATGEIYVVVREKEHATGTPSSSSSAGGSAGGSKPTQSGAASPYSRSCVYQKVGACISLLVCLFV